MQAPGLIKPRPPNVPPPSGPTAATNPMHQAAHYSVQAAGLQAPRPPSVPPPAGYAPAPHTQAIQATQAQAIELFGDQTGGRRDSA